MNGLILLVFPLPHRTGSYDANHAFVTILIHKCNRKLLSQTVMCSAMGLPSSPQIQ